LFLIDTGLREKWISFITKVLLYCLKKEAFKRIILKIAKKDQHYNKKAPQPCKIGYQLIEIG